MFRSSIFNFEALEGFKPRAPKALLLAAALVLCLELGLRLVPDRWLISYNSRVGFSLFMENEVLPQFKQPRIAIFGTSHAADAVSPLVLDRELSLPDYSTVNLGVFGGRTNEWLDLYKRNREKLSKLKLLIVVVDEWSFSSGVTADELMSLNAPLADRWNLVQIADSPLQRELDRRAAKKAGQAEPAPHESSEFEKLNQKELDARAAAKLDYVRMRRNRLLVDWAFNMRLKLPFVPMALVRALPLYTKKDMKFDQERMVRSPHTDVEAGGAVENPLNYHERIHIFYKHFDSHPLYIGYFEELARLTKEDGVRLAILHLPNRHSYQNEVEKLYPEEFAQHIRVTKALAERAGAFFFACRYPEEIGLTDTNYIDYCHMAHSGTDACTHWLAELIKNENLLK